MDSLKRRYKKIKDAAKQSGNGRISNWEFYEAMEKIFGQRPWVAPLSTASSSGPSNNTGLDSSSSDTVSYTSEGDKKKKSRVEQLAEAIYSKVKKDREERHLDNLEAKKELNRLSEERTEVRYKEKMDMRTQFLQVLDAHLKAIDAAARGTTMDCDIKSTQ